jgi:hypothetical protein
MQTDLFVSNSSHSLKLMQKYISLYHINSSTLILHGSIAKNQELIDTDLWRNIHIIEYNSNHMVVIYKIIKIIKNINLNKLYLSHMENIYERIIASYVQKKYTLFDEGITTIEYNIKGLDFLFNNVYSNSLLKKIYLNILCILFNVSFINQSKMISLIDKFITSFDNIKFNKVLTEKITIYQSCINKEILYKEIYFIGQPYYLQNSKISENEYYHIILKIQEYYKSNGFKFIYFKHPREKEINTQIQQRSISINFEEFILNSIKTPEIISSFTSTAFINLHSVKHTNKFEYWKVNNFLDKEDEIIYEYFDLLNIKGHIINEK